MFPSNFVRAISQNLTLSGASLTLLLLITTSDISLAQTHGGALRELSVAVYGGLIHQQNLYVAADEGFFKKNGLSVKYVLIPSGPAGLAAVEGGSIDIGPLDQNLPILSNAQGGDVQFLCGTASLYVAVVARPGLDLPNLAAGYPAVMKDLVGKKLGVSALGSAQQFIFQALFQDAGLDPNAGKYVGVGLQAAALITLLQQGQIDADILLDPVLTAVMTAVPGSKIIVDLRKGQGPAGILGLNPQQVYYAKRSFIAANSDALAAFNKSLQQAAEWQRNPEHLTELIKLMKGHASLGGAFADDSDTFKKMIEENIATSTFTAVPVSSVKNWIAFNQKYAGYSKSVDVDRIAKDILWDKACAN